MWIAGQVCLENRVCFSHPGLVWPPCAVSHAQPWWICSEGHLMGGHGKAGSFKNYNEIIQLHLLRKEDRSAMNAGGPEKRTSNNKHCFRSLQILLLLLPSLRNQYQIKPFQSSCKSLISFCQNIPRREKPILSSLFSKGIVEDEQLQMSTVTHLCPFWYAFFFF